MDRIYSSPLFSPHPLYSHHPLSSPPPTLLGERERELKRAIQARFDVVEPPAIFLKIGNEHLGKKVVRTFGKKRKVQGEVVGWLPAAGDDEALWKVSDDMHHAWMSKKIYPYPHPIHTLLLSYPTLIPPFPNNRPTLTFTLSITLTPTLTSPIIQIRHTDGDEEDLTLSYFTLTLT